MFAKLYCFDVFVSISLYLACFKSLVCMGMTLNIIFEGYTSDSIIWNHIQGYLNHIQSYFFGKKQSTRTFLNFFEACSIQAFSIMDRRYIAYFIWFHPYIYIRSTIWIIWMDPRRAVGAQRAPPACGTTSAPSAGATKILKNLQNTK